MSTQVINLFIVDDNKLMVTELKYYLETRFGSSLNISTYANGEKCLENINDQTDLVILDNYMEGKHGIDILKSIKSMNPKTEVIMHSGNADVALAIEALRAGAKEFIVKDEGSLRKINKFVSNYLAKPVDQMAKKLKFSGKTFAVLLSILGVGVLLFIIVTVLN